MVGGSPETPSQPGASSRGDPTEGAAAESGLSPLICNFLPVYRGCCILERNNDIEGPFWQVPSQQKSCSAIKAGPDGPGWLALVWPSCFRTTHQYCLLRNRDPFPVDSGQEHVSEGPKLRPQLGFSITHLSRAD